MSATPLSHDRHPPHEHLGNTTPSPQKSDKPSTASHSPGDKPDPTTSTPHPNFHPPDGETGLHAEPNVLHSPESEAQRDGAKGGEPATSSAGPSEFARLKVTLRQSLRQFPDFPTSGVLFVDIMPIFASHSLHNSLIRELERQIADAFHTSEGESSDIDVVVGLESRGFLFGPTLALRLGAGFVPVRKQGKLPGPCETESFTKEYGEDRFQMQSDAIRKGAKVIVVDDIIATGGSAAAAGKLVRKLGGNLLGYVFLMEVDFLHGRDNLDAHVHTLLSGQEEALEKADELPLGRTKEGAGEVKPVQDAGGSAADATP